MKKGKRNIPVKKEVSKDHKVRVVEDGHKEFDLEPAMVHYKLGATIQVGDMEFVRIDYSITLPCKPTKKGMAQATQQVKKEVDNFIKKEVKSLKDGAVVLNSMDLI